MKRKIIKTALMLVFVSIIAVVIIHVINLAVLYPWNPEDIVYTEELKPADLIVVLDGEYYARIDYAFKLAELGYSDKIYYPSLKYSQTKERISEKLQEFNRELQFIEGDGGYSTFDEAVLTKEFIIGKNIKSILLVTSPYHSYRSHWIFTKVIPEADIIAATVPFDENWFNLNIIEENEEAKRLVKSEQEKFIIYFLMYAWRWW